VNTAPSLRADIPAPVIASGLSRAAISSFIFHRKPRNSLRGQYYLRVETRGLQTALHDFDFLFRQSVQLIHELVNLPVRCINLALKFSGISAE
jgi:hypothetical protein